jgi:hypothetical protein
MCTLKRGTDYPKFITAKICELKVHRTRRYIHIANRRSETFQQSSNAIWKTPTVGPQNKYSKMGKDAPLSKDVPPSVKQKPQP